MKIKSFFFILNKDYKIKLYFFNLISFESDSKEFSYKLKLN